MADVAELTLRINSSQAEAAAKRTERTLERLDISAKQVGRSMQSLGLKMSAAITAPFLLTARAAIKAGASYEKARISFGVFVGDMKKGEKVFNDILQLAAETPLGADAFQDAAVKLLAMGAATEKNVIPMLKMLGDLSRADANNLQSLALNLGQVASKGRLTGMEIRDFAVRGASPIQALAKMMGKTTDEIERMASAGQISFQDVIKAFQSMTSEGGRFFGLMDKLSKTLTGRWTTAIDNITMTLAEFANVWETELKSVLNVVINVATWFRSLAPQVKRVIAVVAGIAATIGPVLILLGGIVTAVAAVTASFTFLSAIIAPLAPVLLSIVGVIIYIGLAAEGLRRIFGLTWAEIGQGLLDFGMKAIGFVVNFRKNWDLLITWVKNNWQNLIVDLLANIVIFARNLWENFKIAFNLIGGLMGVFGGWFLDNWEMILGQILERITQFVRDTVDLFLNLGKKIMESIRKGMKGESVDINFLDRFVQGSTRTGSLAERISEELGMVDFIPFTRGFQRTTEALPKFFTDLGSLFSNQVTDAAEAATAALPDTDTEDESPINKLASAFEAGSADAFKLLTSREDKSAKMQMKNLNANQATAFSVDRLATDGIKLKGIQTVGSIR